MTKQQEDENEIQDSLLRNQERKNKAAANQVQKEGRGKRVVFVVAAAAFVAAAALAIGLGVGLGVNKDSDSSTSSFTTNFTTNITDQQSPSTFSTLTPTSPPCNETFAAIDYMYYISFAGNLSNLTDDIFADLFLDAYNSLEVEEEDNEDDCSPSLLGVSQINHQQRYLQEDNSTLTPTSAPSFTAAPEPTATPTITIGFLVTVSQTPSNKFALGDEEFSEAFNQQLEAADVPVVVDSIQATPSTLNAFNQQLEAADVPVVVDSIQATPSTLNETATNITLGSDDIVSIDIFANANSTDYNDTNITTTIYIGVSNNANLTNNTVNATDGDTPYIPAFTKFSVYLEEVCSDESYLEDAFSKCKETCEPSEECCDPYASGNSTCWTNEQAGCISYSKCHVLDGALDPAHNDLDRFCSIAFLEINRDMCEFACRNVACCFEDKSCLSSHFQACLDYAPCQNLREESMLKSIDVAPTDLDERCASSSPTCVRDCKEALCCSDVHSDCFRYNLIACLSYSACNTVSDSDTRINIAPIYSRVPPPHAQLAQLCEEYYISMNGSMECQEACTSSRCCRASGAAGCFGDDPLGCIAYEACTGIDDLPTEPDSDIDVNNTDYTFGMYDDLVADNVVTTPLDPYRKDLCDFFDSYQPHIINQCQCNGQVTLVQEDILDMYNQLKTDLMPKLYNGTWEIPVTSCDPQNQALLWLSSGDTRSRGDLVQRYLLTSIYIAMSGTDWDFQNLWLSDQNECLWQGLQCNDMFQIDSIALDTVNAYGTVRYCPLCFRFEYFLFFVTKLALSFFTTDSNGVGSIRRPQDHLHNPFST